VEPLDGAVRVVARDLVQSGELVGLVVVFVKGERKDMLKEKKARPPTLFFSSLTMSP
jgi:hypothetical protein